MTHSSSKVGSISDGGYALLIHFLDFFYRIPVKRDFLVKRRNGHLTSNWCFGKPGNGFLVFIWLRTLQCTMTLFYEPYRLVIIMVIKLLSGETEQGKLNSPPITLEFKGASCSVNINWKKIIKLRVKFLLRGNLLLKVSLHALALPRASRPTSYFPPSNLYQTPLRRV